MSDRLQQCCWRMDSYSEASFAALIDRSTSVRAQRPWILSAKVDVESRLEDGQVGL
tara:strand:+ start:101 stop:268 length:168 start_codon:yes stop_codon:yes gene_type:complete